MRLAQNLFAATVACLSVAAASPPAKKAPAPTKPTSQKAQPAAAQSSVKGDPYSVSVPVDATAASVSVAQTLAINGGQARAWGEVSHRLVPQKDWGKLPNLDGPGLQRLIRGYTVADEKRSTTRYIARVTYIFNPGAVRHLLRVSNIGFANQGGTAILVIALSPTYNAHSAWAQAFAQSKYSTMQYPLVAPVGDLVDQSALGPLHLADASWADVEPVASRVRASEAMLIQATNPAASQLTVHMRRIGPGRPFAIPDLVIPIPAGTPPQKAYAMAADQATAAIEDAWKTRTSVDFGKKSKLVAEARLTSLEQWADLQARLSAVPVINDVTVEAMNIGEVRVSISYSGSPDQLRDLAAQSHLTISSREGKWWVGFGKGPAESSDDQ